jgi:hypothetical protein
MSDTYSSCGLYCFNKVVLSEEGGREGLFWRAPAVSFLYGMAEELPWLALGEFVLVETAAAI